MAMVGGFVNPQPRNRPPQTNAMPSTQSGTSAVGGQSMGGMAPPPQAPVVAQQNGTSGITSTPQTANTQAPQSYQAPQQQASPWEQFKNSFQDQWTQILQSMQQGRNEAIAGSYADEAKNARRAREVGSMMGGAFGGRAMAGVNQAALGGEQARMRMRAGFGREDARMGLEKLNQEMNIAIQEGNWKRADELQEFRETMALYEAQGDQPPEVQEDLGDGDMDIDIGMPTANQIQFGASAAGLVDPATGLVIRGAAEGGKKLYDWATSR